MVELYGIARAGMKLSTDYLNIVSFNMANVNTDAFKSLVPVESSGFSHDFSVVNGKASLVDNAYLFSINDQSMGALNPTEGFALTNSNAYFVVSDGNNKWLTRDGDFQLDQSGLVTWRGLRVLNKNGAPANATDLSNGDLFFAQADTERYDRDSIGFVSQGREQLLTADQAGFTTGAMETSNVDVASEMVNLIVAQRAYQFSAKAFRNADDLIEASLNLKGA
ncbi:flagellar basal body rod C-terminal domain-containing protein [Coprothermobacter platensis]|uniref:flagellar basal body rod C-terminal domain-containing protein n=1 Tax=Coprothermobacter platensis TaxID=108819 RepID=UPI0003803449|nr:flagellar basal body rod C-terminal domain-containing protein [Coprothermobacter platensis]